MGAFGSKKPLKEIIRENKRMVDRAIRNLDRERAGMQKQEQILINDIKKAAKAGQLKSARIMAKDLVRIRKHQEKFVGLTAQLRAISLEMTAMGSVHTLQDSMKKVTKAMVTLNKQIKLPELNKTMQEFMKQAEQMEMKQEIMSDSIDAVMDDAEDEKEQEQIVDQVFAEIGIENAEKLPEAGQVKQQEQGNEVEDELQQRLNNLNRQS